MTGQEGSDPVLSQETSLIFPVTVSRETADIRMEKGN